MVDAESPDFIDVCTPPDSHRDLIRRSLARGLHVLCEKPVFVPHPDGYLPLIREIMAAEAVCYPCHNYKFAPILDFMQDVVRMPEFGDVLGAQFRTVRSGHAVGVPEWNPHWRREPGISSGGILRDHGPHSIYLAAHLTGRTPVEVSCLTGNLRRDSYGQTEDTALLIVRCGDGVQINLDVTWGGSYRKSHYSVTGQGGSIVVEDDDVWYTLNGKLTKTSLPSDFNDPSHRAWFARMFVDFLDIVEHRERQAPLLSEALMTSLVIDAAYESADRDGAWVKVAIPELAPEPSNEA
jgi:predicted dehydrogenase